MIALSKRLLKLLTVTCGRGAIAAVACTGADSANRTAGGAAFMAPRSSQSPLEWLEIFFHVDLFRHDADLAAEIGECLQVADLFRGHVLDHDVAEHWDDIDDTLGRHRVLEEVLARLLRIAVDERDRLRPGL